ncbi:hypothetical protein BU17DRAFT_93152 [Hysterangium stoloniferum]|nr:hypothetical protein BU17DRAFT_93152 [Hysterangium stoloniferum]
MEHTELNPFVPQISIFRHPAATFEVHLHIPGVIWDVDIVPHGEYLAISGWTVPRVHLDANRGRGSLLWTDQPCGRFARDVPLKLTEGTECVVLEKRQQSGGYLVRYTVRNILRRGHAQCGHGALHHNQEHLNVYHGGCESSQGYVNQDMNYNYTTGLYNQSQWEHNQLHPEVITMESQPPSHSHTQYFSERPSHVPISHLSRFQAQHDPQPYYHNDTMVPGGGVVGDSVNGVGGGLPYVPLAVQHGINDHEQPSAIGGVKPVATGLLSGPSDILTGAQPAAINHRQRSSVESTQPIVIELDGCVQQPNVPQPASHVSIPAQGQDIIRRSIHFALENGRLSDTAGSQPVTLVDSQGNQGVVNPHGAPDIRGPDNLTLGVPIVAPLGSQGFVGGHHMPIARPDSHPYTLGHQHSSSSQGHYPSGGTADTVLNDQYLQIGSGVGSFGSLHRHRGPDNSVLSPQPNLLPPSGPSEFFNPSPFVPLRDGTRPAARAPPVGQPRGVDVVDSESGATDIGRTNISRDVRSVSVAADDLGNSGPNISSHNAQSAADTSTQSVDRVDVLQSANVPSTRPVDRRPPGDEVSASSFGVSQSFLHSSGASSVGQGIQRPVIVVPPGASGISGPCMGTTNTQTYVNATGGQGSITSYPGHLPLNSPPGRPVDGAPRNGQLAGVGSISKAHQDNHEESNTTGATGTSSNVDRINTQPGVGSPSYQGVMSSRSAGQAQSSVADIARISIEGVQHESQLSRIVTSSSSSSSSTLQGTQTQTGCSSGQTMIPSHTVGLALQDARTTEGTVSVGGAVDSIVCKTSQSSEAQVIRSISEQCVVNNTTDQCGVPSQPGYLPQSHLKDVVPGLFTDRDPRGGQVGGGTVEVGVIDNITNITLQSSHIPPAGGLQPEISSNVTYSTSQDSIRQGVVRTTVTDISDLIVDVTTGGRDSQGVISSQSAETCLSQSANATPGCPIEVPQGGTLTAVAVGSSELEVVHKSLRTPDIDIDRIADGAGGLGVIRSQRDNLSLFQSGTVTLAPSIDSSQRDCPGAALTRSPRPEIVQSSTSTSQSITSVVVVGSETSRSPSGGTLADRPRSSVRFALTVDHAKDDTDISTTMDTPNNQGVRGDNDDALILNASPNPNANAIPSQPLPAEPLSLCTPDIGRPVEETGDRRSGTLDDKAQYVGDLLGAQGSQVVSAVSGTVSNSFEHTQLTTSIKTTVGVDATEESQLKSILRPGTIIDAPPSTPISTPDSVISNVPISDRPLGTSDNTSVTRYDDRKGAIRPTVSNVESLSSESLQENINTNVHVHVEKSDVIVESNITKPDVGTEISNPGAIPIGEALEYFHERDENIASSEDKANVRRIGSSGASHVGGLYMNIAKSSSEKSGSTNLNQSMANVSASNNAHLDPTAGGLGGPFVVVGGNENIAGGVFEAVRDVVQNTTHKIVSQVTTSRRITTSSQTQDVISETIQTVTGGSDNTLQDANSGEAIGTNLRATKTEDDQHMSQAITHPAFEEQHTTFSEQVSAVAKCDTLGRGHPDRDVQGTQNDAGKTESGDVRVIIQGLGGNGESSFQAQTQWTKIDTLDIAAHGDHRLVSAPIDNDVVAGSQVGVGTWKQGCEVGEISRNRQQQVVEHGVQSNLSHSSDSRVQLFSTGANNTLTQNQNQTGSEERLVVSSHGRKQGLSVLSSGTVSFPSQKHVDVSITSKVVRGEVSARNSQTSGTQESGAVASVEGQLLEAMEGDWIGSMSLVDRGPASSESRSQQQANWVSKHLSFHGSMELSFDQGATDALGETTGGIHEHVDPVSVLPNQIQPLEDAESVGGRGDTKIDETTVTGSVSQTALEFQTQGQGTLPSRSNSTSGEQPVLTLSHTERFDSNAEGVKQSGAFVDSSETTAQCAPVIIGASHQSQNKDTSITINNTGVQEIGQSNTEYHQPQDICHDSIGLPISTEGKMTWVGSNTTNASVDEGKSREGLRNEITGVGYSGSPIRHTGSNAVVTESESSAQLTTSITQTVQESARSYHEKTDGIHTETSMTIIEQGLGGDHCPSNASGSILEGDAAVTHTAIPPDRAMAPGYKEAEVMGKICHGIDERLSTTSTLSVNAENNDVPEEYNKSPLPPEDSLTARLSPPPPPRPASPSNSANPRDDLARGTIGFNQSSIAADPADVLTSPSQHPDQVISTVPSPIVPTTFSTDEHHPSEPPLPLQIGSPIIPTPEKLLTPDVTTPKQAISVLGQESMHSAMSPTHVIEPVVGLTSVVSREDIQKTDKMAEEATVAPSTNQPGPPSSQDAMPPSLVDLPYSYAHAVKQQGQSLDIVKSTSITQNVITSESNVERETHLSELPSVANSSSDLLNLEMSLKMKEDDPQNGGIHSITSLSPTNNPSTHKLPDVVVAESRPEGASEGEATDVNRLVTPPPPAVPLISPFRHPLASGPPSVAPSVAESAPEADEQPDTRPYENGNETGRDVIDAHVYPPVRLFR